ncbi:uncharacterized protein LOC142775966 [Rhipicephalus microplus]|uniref:uncharacterized protein LOC142775966 n=1 Tax=Rhipicephalus microplus TaxID=6941 RepID=UPI003F6B508E
MHRHVRNVHKINSAERKINCDECDQKFFTVCELRQNHIDEHDFTPEYEEYTFRTMNEFKKWKKNVEEETFSCFTATGSKWKSGSSGKELSYYTCHRSGSYASQASGQRKAKPTIKCGKRCFAGMNVSKESYGIKVILQSKHRGHGPDPPK